MVIICYKKEKVPKIKIKVLSFENEIPFHKNFSEKKSVAIGVATDFFSVIVAFCDIIILS